MYSRLKTSGSSGQMIGTEMKRLYKKNMKVAILTLSAFMIFSSTFIEIASAKKPDAPITLGLWHFDKTQASGDSVVTADSISFNNGIFLVDQLNRCLLTEDLIKL